MARYGYIADLADEVTEAHLDNYIGDEQFLPRDKLKKFVTESTVKSAFQDAGILDAEDELMKFVFNGSERIFLILVLMTGANDEKLSMLTHFRHYEINDASLPIGFRKDSVQGNNWYGVSLEDPDRSPFSIFPERNQRSDRELFDRYQWRLIAPVFGNGKFRFQFNPKRILPYLKGSPTATSSGFFGEVSRIEIHRAHISVLPMDSNTEGVAIAVKKAKDREELADYFDKEANNLRIIHQYNSPHLIKPIAAYQISHDRCLIFPWADGGNLGDYWKNYENKSLEIDSLQWIVGQFVGICSALGELHFNNCRHGDLKPENILWFKNNDNKGTLQIADLGLAAFHKQEAHTKLRKGIQTLTPSGTSRYEPPEMDEYRNTDEPRSRAYDIWSMGCIVLELLIWLIYGHNAVMTFGENTRYFWDLSVRNGQRVYSLHPYVTSCMKIMDTQLRDNTAYKELLQLVRERLLVIPVSETHDSRAECREIATVLHVNIKAIQGICQSDPSYLTPVRLEYSSSRIQENISQQGRVYQRDGALAAPERTDAPRTRQTSLPINNFNLTEDNMPRILFRAATGELNSVSSSTHASRSTEHQEQSSKLNDIWESIPDNDFAFHLFTLIEWDRVKPYRKEVSATLCFSCSTIDSTQLFGSECDISKLQSMSHICDLCSLLFKALDEASIRLPRVVRLRQNGAIVGLENGPDLLSIYVEPGSNMPRGTQLGLPRLLEQASKDQFAILKEWIRVCDSTHDICRRDNDEDTLTMPTRLIEVGEPLRLVDSASIEPSRYIALSHCWGPLKENEKFCTYKRNIVQLKASIDFKLLTRTFRDAITVTRGLGIKYIWIDSLCIIQDDKEDWESESDRMEQVFSAAYCTIGASSAKSSLEGFLLYRTPRPCVRLWTRSTGALYVCPAIDDFYRDVELGELNRRGWVLQERALSRRSIHYTSTQVYWECGAGVHCETLARLQNSKAAFLGDANFPKSALEYYRDGRQLLIQDLYERYSGLAFTKPSDRSIAILGLQKRLARAFRTQAAYSFFAVYFARGLLWKRRDIRSMTRIAQPAGRRAPSWSWFSKEGAIKYMELKFEKIDWATKDFESPFARQLATEPTKSSGSMAGGDLAILRGVARMMTMTKLEMLVYVSFDDEREFEVDDLRCVVIGRDKLESAVEDPKRYVLVIHQVNSALEEDTYERVGVASLRPAHVGSEGSWVSIL